MIGQTLGHYRILEKIGAGGMGEVYRASDEHLGRDVAIKVLPAGTLADESARRRFRQEALALSKLNHPNIATVHDFDSQDGVDFLVMEFVEGASLAQKIELGPLPEKEIASLGAQIADALEDAHERSIVHRDLKPGNILITPKGRVKVLDFGLARLLRQPSDAEDTESLINTRSIEGTLAYMAPEQLRGEPADGRADIHAAGAVLYEMSTGRRSFPEELQAPLIDAILHATPVPPRALNARISGGLETTVLKCLEKEPEHRYQSAKELGVDLRRLVLARGTTSALVAQAAAPSRRGLLLGSLGVLVLAGVLWAVFGRTVLNHYRLGAGPRRISSLAVLPLENLSGDPSQEYFADGMTEQLTTDLAQIGALRVISRTSAMQYRQTKKTLPEIAHELNVDGVVEGSVERSGDQVMITAQLIHARSDTHLWAKSYKSDLRNVLALQDEMARTIAKEIEVTLTPQENHHLTSARAVNPEAHEAYLKGRYYLNKSTEKDLETSIDYFKQAQRIDPQFAEAYAGTADAYTASGDLYWSPAETMPKAKEATQKALELDESSAEAHTSLAAIRFYYDLDWPATEKEIKRALELNPNSAAAYELFGTYLAALGRIEEAIANSKRARELDPLSLPVNLDLGWSYLMAGRYDDAIEQFSKTLELDPNFAAVHAELGETYAAKHEFEKAIAEVDKAAQLEDSPFVIMVRADVYAISGRKREAKSLIDAMNASHKQRYICPFELAAVYVGLSENDKAMGLYERANREGSMCIVFLKGDPPWIGKLHSDPRFTALLRRVGLPP